MQISGNIISSGYVSGNIRSGNFSSGGTDDYNNLRNRPMINGIVLAGDMLPEDIGIYAVSDEEIDFIIDGRTASL